MNTTQPNTDLSILDKPESPKQKAVQALQEWADQTDNPWKEELLEANALKLKHEVQG